MNSYTVKFKHFEGPFDLILYFIQKDELDIYDIPISKVADDFLQYIKKLEALNLDIAAEFILVAASLMRIKAKLLIPRKEIDEEGNEIDPRDELVQRLLEYKQYKDVIGAMTDMEQERAQKVLRGNTSIEIKSLAKEALVDVDLDSVDTYKLFKAFRRVMEKYQNVQDKYVHQIVKYPYTLKDQQAYLRSFLSSGKKYSFVTLFTPLDNRMHAIVTFLSLLELLNAQVVKMIDSLEVNDFYIVLTEKSEGKKEEE